MGKEIPHEIKRAIAYLVENYRIAVLDELKDTRNDVFMCEDCGNLFTTPKLAGLAYCECGGTARLLICIEGVSMNWEEFKQIVDERLEAKGISPDEDIHYIDISMPLNKADVIIELGDAGLIVRD